MESEAGHYTLFIELAETYLPKDIVRKRWQEWLTYEATVMQEMEVRGTGYTEKKIPNNEFRMLKYKLF